MAGPAARLLRLRLTLVPAWARGAPRPLLLPAGSSSRAASASASASAAERGGPAGLEPPLGAHRHLRLRELLALARPERGRLAGTAGRGGARPEGPEGGRARARFPPQAPAGGMGLPSQACVAGLCWLSSPRFSCCICQGRFKSPLGGFDWGCRHACWAQSGVPG